MIGWMLNVVYLLVIAAASPVLLYRAVRQRKYREGWREKLWGQAPSRRGDRPCVWFHAVSVGEVLLLQTVIAELHRRRPGLDLWISTTTRTGHAVARERFADCRVVYFPLDFTWAVKAAVRRIRPDVVVLVELELWPNFIRAVSASGAPLLLINGRLGERSFRGYRRIRRFMGPLLRRFTTLAVQTETHRRRLLELGAPDERTVVTGSVKFDVRPDDGAASRIHGLRDALDLGNGETVLVAGSTHAPEEELILESYRRLAMQFPDLRLIIAPRHAERFDEVARLIESSGFPLRRRSRRTADAETQTTRPVVLLDTLGELSACWRLADVAFVGGSLTRRGGQNMIEPCAHGAAVLFGPNTWNFRHVVEMLLRERAAIVVAAAGDLTHELRRVLETPQAARRQGERARRLVLSQQGATDQTVTLITAAVDRERARPSQQAA